jgi:hypothetical protein
MSDEPTNKPTGIGAWIGTAPMLLLAMLFGILLGVVFLPRCQTPSPPPAAPAPTMDVHDLFKECLRAAYRNGVNQNDCVAIYYDGPDR